MTRAGTLLVGDEPRDIVFGGWDKGRAFITTAHRGQNSPIDPKLTTPSIGRADVWVFDAAQCCNGTKVGGTPLNILTFFSDTPRALAVTPDGSKVYAAAFASGNATASTFGGSTFGIDKSLPPVQLFPFLPFPINVNAFGEAQSLTGVIAKYDGKNWKDENGLIRNAELPFSMPDRDVFDRRERQSAARPWRPLGGVFARWNDPVQHGWQSGQRQGLRLSNLESNNMQRFEGANAFAGCLTKPTPSVRGKIALSRITVLDQGGNVQPRHLNKHIDYSTCCTLNPVEDATSVAFPLAMEITANGQTLYVSALGSSRWRSSTRRSSSTIRSCRAWIARSRSAAAARRGSFSTRHRTACTSSHDSTTPSRLLAPTEN